MSPMKLDVLTVFFSYGGNGGLPMITPELRSWWSDVVQNATKDERIGRFADADFSDTPIPMMRNRAVKWAMEGGYDLVMMIDSDNIPDLYGTDFFSTSFDFIYKRKLHNLPTVVGAPYCGPPPHPTKGGEENVYVFEWEGNESDDEQPSFKIVGYGRNESTVMEGIHPCAALPTGVILFDVEAFNLIDLSVSKMEVLNKVASGELSPKDAMQRIRRDGWFYYEYDDEPYCTSKGSTEDVTATRDLSLAGHAILGEPIVFCNWSTWAGHKKVKTVGKPRAIASEHISTELANAGASGIETGEKLLSVDFPVPSVTKPDVKANGYAGAKKLVLAGQPVTQIGIETPQHDLEALTTLVEKLRESKSHPLRIAEIGSWVGTSALAMVEGMGPDGGVVHCIDTWQGTYGDPTGHYVEKNGSDEVYSTFLANVGGYLGKQVLEHHGDSQEVADSFTESQELDLVYIDGDHSFDAVTGDIAAWLRHVREDGVIAGHDYGSHAPEVIDAVDTIFGDLVNRLENSTVWYVLKSEYTEKAKELLATRHE